MLLLLNAVPVRDAQGAQSVGRPTSAQVMISQCEFKPHIGLLEDSVEPAYILSPSLSLSLSAPPPLTCTHSFSLSE